MRSPRRAVAEDAIRLLDHLGIDRVDVLGYSMGARIAAFLAFAHPDRVRSIVFGGLGIHMVRGMVGAGPLAAALEAPRLEDVTNDTARSFRVFAEQTKSDLKALAACMRGPREKVPREKLGELNRRFDLLKQHYEAEDPQAFTKNYHGLPKLLH